MALARPIPADDVKTAKEDVGRTSQFTLMRRRFIQSKLSLFGMAALAIMYLGALFAPFIAPYDYNTPDANSVYRPPATLEFADGGLATCGTSQELNHATFTWVYVTDCSKAIPIRFFTQGFSYTILGFIPSDIHLYGGADGSRVYLLGTDSEGRDMVSRLLFGSRVSLTIGLVGVAISTLIGGILGTVSGYFGGVVDNIIQRIIEILLSMPSISLWMAFSAALPQNMSVVNRYFLITLILAIIGWTILARQVRAKVMGYKNQDYTSASRLAGASHTRIILQHLMPNSMSHIIVTAALGIPATILGETTLSFLGLGMLPPAVSWGVLLSDAQQVQVVEQHVWLLIPAGAVIFAVVCFLFIADGLRDAVDPYG